MSSVVDGVAFGNTGTTVTAIQFDNGELHTTDLINLHEYADGDNV